MVAAADTISFPVFSNFIEKRQTSASKTILKSIVESFEERSRVYCVVIIYDDDLDIGIEANSLCKYPNTICHIL